MPDRVSDIKPWLFLDSAPQAPPTVSSWTEFADDLAGWVCSERVGEHLPSDAHWVCSASTETELRDWLLHDRDVFVPADLAEGLGLLSDRAGAFRGSLWLEDSYVARYLVANQPTAPIGLVGTTPDRGRLVSHVRYAFMFAEGTEAATLSAALQLGAESVWLRASSTLDLQQHLRRIADVAEAADLASLFGALPAELGRTWQRRLCLAAARALPAGHQLSETDLIHLPASGALSAELRHKVIGRRLRYPLAPDAVLTFGVLEC